MPRSDHTTASPAARAQRAVVRVEDGVQPRRQGQTAVSHSVLLSLTIGIFSLLLALVGAEVIVRCAGLDLPPKRAWDDRPQQFFLPEERLGTVDAAVALEKPDHAFRIAVVGDSFSYGQNLQFDDTFSKRMERWLNLNRGDGRAQVLNFGVSGFSTRDEVASVRFALRYHPDLLLLQVTLNDPALKPFREQFRSKPEDPDATLWDRLRGVWRTLNFVDMRLRNTRSTNFYVEYHRGLFERPETWNSFVKAAEEIKALGESQKVKVIAVVFPMFSFPFDERYPFHDIHAKLQQFFASQQLLMLDLLPAFRGIPPDRLQVLPGEDGHPNEIAHRIAAEKILEWMSRQDLVPADLFPHFHDAHRIDRPFLQRLVDQK